MVLYTYCIALLYHGTQAQQVLVVRSSTVQYPWPSQPHAWKEASDVLRICSLACLNIELSSENDGVQRARLTRGTHYRLIFCPEAFISA